MNRKHRYRLTLETLEGRLVPSVASRAVTVIVNGGDLVIVGTGNDDLVQVMDARNGATPVYRVKQTFEGRTHIIADIPTSRVTGDELYFLGQNGNDYFKYTTSRPKVLTVLADGGIGNDIMWGFSNDDVLFGGEGTDYLYGWTGHDLLMGAAGNDILKGGTDDDFIIGGAGRDDLYGEYGKDILLAGDWVESGMLDTEQDRLDGGPNLDAIFVGPGDIVSPTERNTWEIKTDYQAIASFHADWRFFLKNGFYPRREIIDSLTGMPGGRTPIRTQPWWGLVEPMPERR
jgi:Ca2+-binding RTX toxin-like protein